MCGWKSPYSSMGRKEAQSCGVPGLGLRIPLNGLGLSAAGLRDERSIEESRGQEGAAAEGRFGAELFEHQLLHRVVEQAPTGANAGLAD